jgi:hypothetical protein
MAPELKEMLENGEISEIEIINLIRTLKKLGENDFMDKRNVDLVINHFGMKRKKKWLKFDEGVKIRI